MSLRLLTYTELLDSHRIIRRPLFPSLFPRRYDPTRKQKIHSKFQGSIVLFDTIMAKSSLPESQEPDPSDSPYTHFDCGDFAIDLRSYVLGKENANGSITGSSGSGKSALSTLILTKLDDFQRIVFSFKSGDHALNIGIPSVDARKVLPSIFADSDALKASYHTAFSASTTNVGIQLQATSSILVELTDETRQSKSAGWEQFIELLKKKAKGTKDKNQLATLNNIEQNIRTLMMKDTSSTALSIGDESLVLDFSGFSTVEAKTFYAELILRQLWNDLQSGRRKNMFILIDEAHNIPLAKSSHSVIVPMSKLIRDRGRLWLITQNLSEISELTTTNLGTQFAFKSGGSDLQIAAQKNRILHFALSQLKPHEFIDINFGSFFEYVPILHYFTPTLSKPPTANYQQKLDAEGSVPPANEKSGKGEGDGAAEEEEKPKSELELTDQEVVALLPNYSWQIIKALSLAHNVPVEEIKFAVSQNLKHLVKIGIAGRIRLVSEVRHIRPKAKASFYFQRGKNVSKLHKYMTTEAKGIVGRIFRTREATDQQYSNPDLEILVERDGSEESITIIEIETGLSNGNVTNLKSRIIDALDRKKTALVIVPNEEERTNYKDYLHNFIVDFPSRLNVLTLLELKEWISDLQNRQPATEARSVQPDTKMENGGAENG